MKTRFRTGIICILTIALFSAVVSQAKVFSRWKKSGLSAELSRLGAKSAYRTAVKINDSDATLEVFTWKEPFDAVVSQLRRTCFSADRSGLVAENGTAFGALRQNNRVVRMLVTMLKGQCIIFRIEQSAAAYKSSHRKPLRHRLTSLPVREDSNPLLYMENTSSGSRMEMSVSQSDPEEVSAFFESSLKAAGWKRSIEPKRSTIPTPAMSTYVKGKDVCCIFVARSRNARKTFTTVVYRPIRFAK
jgi:hypothetical protein